MKKLYYAICLTALVLFVWLAVYSYQQRPTTLAQLIDRSNQQLVEHKMAELYGE